MKSCPAPVNGTSIEVGDGPAKGTRLSVCCGVAEASGRSELLCTAPLLHPRTLSSLKRGTKVLSQKPGSGCGVGIRSPVQRLAAVPFTDLSSIPLPGRNGTRGLGPLTGSRRQPWSQLHRERRTIQLRRSASCRFLLRPWRVHYGNGSKDWRILYEFEDAGQRHRRWNEQDDGP